jgi:hypothetical protein
MEAKTPDWCPVLEDWKEKADPIELFTNHLKIKKYEKAQTQ